MSRKDRSKLWPVIFVIATIIVVTILLQHDVSTNGWQIWTGGDAGR